MSAISEELYKTEVTIEVETNEEGAVFHIQVRRMLWEKNFDSTFCGDGVYFTAQSLSVIVKSFVQ